MDEKEKTVNQILGEEAVGEPDTCRICRGEGGPSESLFHPCKCSGSIKYVHQDCLIEWLSHSQKKHCELCKTAFRITKLYSPNMPESLPFHVLIKHISIHTVKGLVSFVRLNLVLTVWLVVLPYMIRQIWRFLFWFSEGGRQPNDLMDMGSDTSKFLQSFQASKGEEVIQPTGNAIPLATPLNTDIANSTKMATVVDRILEFLLPTSQTCKISGSDGIATKVFNLIYNGLGIQSSVNPESFVNQNSKSTGPGNTSLLSEVSFFQHLTNNPSFNQLIINIVEGYIITVLVVVGFILVFLIREWVVQQEAGINMNEEFNEEFNAIDGPRNEQQDLRPLANTERQTVPLMEGDLAPEDNVRQTTHDPELTNEIENTSVRDVLAPTAEIRKSIVDPPRIGAELFEIWRRVEGDPVQMLHVIEADGKTEQFSEWVNAIKILINSYENNGVSSRTLTMENMKSVFLDGLLAHLASESKDNTKQSIPQDDRQIIDAPSKLVARPEIPTLSSMYQLLEQNSIDYRDTSEMSANSKKDKGKSRSHDPDLLRPIKIEILNSEGSVNIGKSSLQPIPHPLSPWKKNSNGGAFRPRSMSDSPQHRGPSPLSTNSWSFPRVSTENEIDELKFTEDSSVKRTYDVINENPNLEENLDAINDSNPHDTGEALHEALKAIKTNNNPAREVEPYESIDALLGNNDISSSKDTNEVLANDPTTEIAFHPDSPVNTNHQDNSQRPEIQSSHNGQPNVRRAAPQTILGTLTDYLWGGVGDDEPNENSEAGLEDTRPGMIAEAPMPAAADDNELPHGANEEVVHELAEVPAVEGMDLNDPDAIEDAEDFEGIMELLGMRGPIFSLVQNALFSALLLGITIVFCVWLPYIIGGASIMSMENPGVALTSPIWVIFDCAALMQDIALSLIGLVLSFIFSSVAESYNLLSYFSGLEPSEFFQLNTPVHITKDISLGALQRMKNNHISHAMHIKFPELSAARHESLIKFRNLLANSFLSLGNFTLDISTGNYEMTLESMMTALKKSFTTKAHLLNSLLDILTKKDFWVIILGGKKRATPIDPELSVWNGTDRFIAVIIGYTVIFTLGSIYVRKRSPYISGRVGHEFEKSIIDLFRQAGGVTKVILIISIEMLLFPLYCGLLLDFSLLPIFEKTTILSRVQFTQDSPLTSIFVHWFIGTCYMFHFALFVSMCRRIMRKGVLYFIRDPDDPTFHPVRDVLERNVTTQLQKILFSALVYGGLILVCLGGVVWGIDFAFNGILPVHWSSNEPVMEFPIDLLFYNFSIPLAVKYFKPSTKLHAMYSWWFRQSARALRLTWFLLDERRLDEEGHLVRKNWSDFLRRSKGNPYLMVTSDDSRSVFENNPQWHAYYRRDGRYVRAPASDQVRIPKGSRIFLEVNEMNNRIDQKPDRNNGIHGKESNLYKQVYIPPWFRLRISIFVLSIWMFAAVTGIGLTIIPLVLGRKVYSRILPIHVHKNDVYAFSIGIFIIATIMYFVLNLRKMLRYIRSPFVLDVDKPKEFSRYVFSLGTRVARITWTYAAFLFILPTLFTFTVELYFIVPLHTYLALGEKHVVPFVQNWTLGLLYVKLTTQLILLYENSRPAQSLRAITRNGYLNPDARLATRSFILPGALLVSIALIYPLALARLVVMTILQRSPEKHVLAYRYSYPICLSLCFLALFLWVMTGWVHNWKIKIKDEVYLDGEQLHNFGEKRVQQTQTNTVRRNGTRNI